MCDWNNKKRIWVIPDVKYCLRKWVTNLNFCHPVNLSLILKIISVQPASLLSRKYLLVEGKEFFCSWKVSKFLHPASFVNARKVDVSEFQVKNYSQTRPSVPAQAVVYTIDKWQKQAERPFPFVKAVNRPLTDCCKTSLEYRLQFIAQATLTSLQESFRQRLPTLVNPSQTVSPARHFLTGARGERGVHIWQGFCLLIQSTFDYWIEARFEYCIIYFVNKLRNQRTETICH